MPHLSSTQYADWEDFFTVHPWRVFRQDLHATKVCEVLANVNRDPKKKREPFRAADFAAPWMPHYEEPPDTSPNGLIESLRGYKRG